MPDTSQPFPTHVTIVLSALRKFVEQASVRQTGDLDPDLRRKVWKMLKSDPKNDTVRRAFGHALLKARRYDDVLELCHREELSKPTLWLTIFEADARLGLSDYRGCLNLCTEARKNFLHSDELRLRATTAIEQCLAETGNGSTDERDIVEVIFGWLAGDWRVRSISVRLLRALIRKLGKRTDAIRSQLEGVFAGREDKQFFIALIAHLAEDYDVARLHIRDYALEHPADLAALRLAVNICQRQGRWQEDRPIFILGVAALPPSDSNRQTAIETLDSLVALRKQLGLDKKMAFGRKLFKRLEMMAPRLSSAKKKFLSGSDAEEELLCVPRAIAPLIKQRRESGSYSSDRSSLMYFCGSLAPGGAERVVCELFSGTKSAGVFKQVNLMVADLHSSPQKSYYLAQLDDEAPNVQVLPQSNARPGTLAFLTGAMANKSAAVYRVLQQHQPDVAHFSLDFLNLAGGIAAIEAGVPRIILHSHNMRPPSLGYSEFQLVGWTDLYRALLESEGVTFVNCSLAGIEDYLDWIEPARADAQVVYNGFDFPEIGLNEREKLSRTERQSLNVGDEEIVVGTAMRFADVKRPALWVETAVVIQQLMPDVVFVMYGDGPLRDDAIKLIEQHGLHRSFRLPGNVAALPEKLAALDLFMLTSASEGLPNVILEAQAHGTPVLATDVGGIKEAMKVGETGRVCNSDDAHDLARAAVSMLSDQDWMRSAHVDGPPYVRSKFGRNQMIENMLKIIRSNDLAPYHPTTDPCGNTHSSSRNS